MKKSRLPYIIRFALFLKERFPSLSGFFSGIRAIFTSRLFKVSVNLSFPTIFFILGKRISSLNDRNLLVIVSIAVVYIIINFLILSADEYNKHNLLLTGCYTSMLNKINIMYRDIAAEVKQLNKNINNSHNFSDQNIQWLPEIMENNSIIDSIAYIICKSTFEWLKELTGESCFKISMYQRFRDNSGVEYIKLIASEYGDNGSPEFDERINLYEQGNKYYFRLLFEKNANDIDVLCNREEILKKFYIDKDQIEVTFCQHVSIPVRINSKTTFLLQITSDKENLFGKNKGEIKNGFKILLPLVNVIVPFCYKDKLIMDLCTNFVKYAGPKKKKGGLI